MFGEGDYRCLTPAHSALWVYLRTSADARLLVIANFRDQPQDFEPELAPLPVGWRWQLLSANWPQAPERPGAVRPRPYEALIYLAHRG